MVLHIKKKKSASYTRDINADYDYAAIAWKSCAAGAYVVAHIAAHQLLLGSSGSEASEPVHVSETLAFENIKATMQQVCASQLVSSASL